MSNIVRDNEIRALERMNMTLSTMKTVFPADRDTLSAWFRLVADTQTLIAIQEEYIKTLDR